MSGTKRGKNPRVPNRSERDESSYNSGMNRGRRILEYPVNLNI